MEWEKNSSNPEDRNHCEGPEKGGLAHSYPELEPVFESMGITSEEDKEIIIAYVSELFQIAFEYLNTKGDQEND